MNRKKFDDKYNRTIRGQFRHGLAGAKRRRIIWSLTIQQFEKIRVGPCYYCELPLDQTGSGLDRVDSSKGYEIENVVACCRRCNETKMNNWTMEETKAMVTLALNLRAKKLIAS